MSNGARGSSGDACRTLKKLGRGLSDPGDITYDHHMSTTISERSNMIIICARQTLGDHV